MLIEQNEIKTILERRKSSKKKSSVKKKKKKSPSKFEDIFLGENMSMATNNTIKFENKNKNYDKKNYINQLNKKQIYNDNKYRINKKNKPNRNSEKNLKWNVVKQGISNNSKINKILEIKKENHKNKNSDKFNSKIQNDKKIYNSKLNKKIIEKNSSKKNIIKRPILNKYKNNESNNIYYKKKKINFKFEKENYKIPEKILNFNLLDKLNYNLKFFKNLPKPEDKYILLLLSDGLNIKK